MIAALPIKPGNPEVYISVNKPRQGSPLSTAGKALGDQAPDRSPLISDVSPNTVSRFLRRLGYKGLQGLKKGLRDDVRVQSLLNTTLLSRVEQQSDDLSIHLNKEIDALVKFWEQLGSQHWLEIVDRVRHAEKVFICGFQTIRGIVEDFSNRLSLVHSDVEFLDLYSGVLGQWLDSYEKRCCIVSPLKIKYSLNSDLRRMKIG